MVHKAIYSELLFYLYSNFNVQIFKAVFMFHARDILPKVSCKLMWIK